MKRPARLLQGITVVVSPRHLSHKGTLAQIFIDLFFLIARLHCFFPPFFPFATQTVLKALIDFQIVLAQCFFFFFFGRVASNISAVVVESLFFNLQ